MSGGGAQALVAAVCKVPLLGEALAASFEGIAELRSFPGELEDIDGLLRSLHPDAVVVDSRSQAAQAEPYARASQAPLVHVLLREQKLRVLRNGDWEADDSDGASAEAIRNAVVAGLYGRQPV
ncbi:MAG TPA: hypothetical protein VF002_05035 [Gaiellaceae bacterium]